MVKINSKKSLVAKCKKHPRYAAERWSKTKCTTCLLLYVLRWQHDKKAERMLGSLNPYAYLLSGVDMEYACSYIKIHRCH